MINILKESETMMIYVSDSFMHIV